MAEPKMYVRLGWRAAAVLALAALLLTGALPIPSGAAPESDVRIVPVPLAELLPASAHASLSPRSAGLRLAAGELRAAVATETAATAVCSPIEVTGLGVTWEQPGRGDVHAEVRTEREGGWSRPVHLGSEDDADPGSPDANSRRGSSFLWTGGGRCIRLALELDRGVRVSDVAVVFVDSSGEVPSAGGFAGTAQAFAKRPRVVTRQAWGADPKLLNCTPSVADRVLMGFVHHTAGTNAYSPAEADDVIRGVYAFHTNGRGWCDIGYNFLVDRFGTVYEGRSGGMTEPVIGAAQMGFNTRAFSVSVMGNFETAAVPTAVQRALVRLLAWRLDLAHVNPSARATMVSAGGSNTRYEAGQVVRLPTIAGHRDTGLTACPGDRLYKLLPSIREKVAKRGLPKIWKPRLTEEGLVAGTPTKLRILARGSTDLRWSVTLLGPDGAAIADLGTRNGTRLALRWPKTGPPPQPTVPGTYTVQITGDARGGATARPASLPLVVAPPTPSPTPSPTTSPPPSPSPSP
ncbi:MAG TPA: N-acetylmuramoyl-L-alanine amidase [Actinomycetota bacterium]